ncbi:MAG: phosphoribosylformylglycinamidine synthase subunit PurL [Deferribacteraceae bacterium]|jgi:phosphoribosylformylglycinamidine synthase|nr:phosphoribosylformylglycinamidine synthase subunit PurL [Deferribacteraceae bacterium]
MSVYDTFNYPAVNPETACSMGLSVSEFRLAEKILGRTPNYVELGCISAMWSEHCSYKSSKLHLRKLPTKGENVVFGPGENAGVILADGDICLCFKIESHNHPSFIEPFHGAATGVGGILRDVFTMGARPIAAMNSLRFGELNNAKTVSIMRGVVSGIAHYGNCFGVPTVGGEAVFHESYAKNPLVNAFALGVVREKSIFTAAASGAGNPVIYIGSKTGRDGIHGATMASGEFGKSSIEKRPNTQIGDPFKEKLLLEACLELMQTDALVGIQDMGAAGLTSSAFEMAGRAGSGVVLELDKVPVRESGLTPYEIMLSESQERMLLVAKKGREAEVQAIVQKWDLDASIIGRVTDDGLVRLLWHGEETASVPAAPLSDAAPVYDRPYKKPEGFDTALPDIAVPKDLNSVFYRLIASPTIASKRWIYEQYDHMVLAATAVLPGGDAAVVKIPGSKKGVALSSDCIGRYCYLSPRKGGALAVAESARNAAAVGARPAALTNCLNYGNPEKPEIMYQLVEGIEGIAEAAIALNVPVVSGNVSLYNETEGEAIFPTPVISMVGLLNDAEKHITSYFKREGSTVIAIGDFPNRIDASHYLEFIHRTVKGEAPEVKLNFHKTLIDFMADAEDVLSAHDLSDGGLAVALFEMTIKNRIGLSAELIPSARADALLFGESPMMIIEAEGENTIARLEKFGLPYKIIGKTGGDTLTIKAGREIILNIEIEKAAVIYEKIITELMS